MPPPTFGLKDVVTTEKMKRDERNKRHVPPKENPVKQEDVVVLNALEKQRLAIDDTFLYAFVTPTILPMFYEVSEACKQLDVPFDYSNPKLGIVRRHESFSLETLTFQISILRKSEPFRVVCQLHFTDQLPTDDMSPEEYQALPRELYYCFDGRCTTASDVLLSGFRKYITMCFETS